MKINMKVLKALELKLSEDSKINGTTAKHESANANCRHGCMATCTETINAGCGTYQYALAMVVVLALAQELPRIITNIFSSSELKM